MRRTDSKMFRPWLTSPAAISPSPSAPLRMSRCAGPARRLLDDLGQLIDQHPVERDPIVRRGRFGLNPHLRGVGLGQQAYPLRFRLGRLDHLGYQLLLAELGLALGEFGLRGDDLALRVCLGQRPGLCRFRLCLVDLGLVLRLNDRRLA